MDEIGKMMDEMREHGRDDLLGRIDRELWKASNEKLLIIWQILVDL